MWLNPGSQIGYYIYVCVYMYIYTYTHGLRMYSLLAITQVVIKIKKYVENMESWAIGK